MLCGVFAVAIMSGVPAHAQDQNTGVRRPALLERILACRTITGVEERLICFDQAAEAFEIAERQGEVTVVDQTQAQETRTRLFGLNLDSANLWSGLRLGERIEAIETTLVRGSTDGRGRAVLVLADGSTWRQVDSERINARLTAGTPVRIRQAAVGSYLLSVNGTRSVRARRDH